jgi:hypothetical protein
VLGTAADDQPAVTIQVLQGERELAADDRLLAQFDLDGLAPRNCVLVTRAWVCGTIGSANRRNVGAR